VYVYAGRDGIVPIGFVDYASADAEPASGQSYSVHTDHHGAVERVYNARGKLVWRCAYAPYGAARVEVGAGFYQPLRMPGHYWDADTQLHYNRFRYYDPALARYLESDPLGIAGGANLYAYTWNPLSEVDIRGLARKCDDGTPGLDSGHAGEGRPNEAAPVARQARANRNGNALSDEEAADKSRIEAERARHDLARRAALRLNDPDYVSKRQAGPVVVAVVDARSGQTFVRTNDPNHEPPANIHPTLAPLLKESQDNPAHPTVPGEHAEVHATNDALHARTHQGLPDGPEALDDMHMTPVWTKGSDRAGKREGGMVAGDPAPRCGNCQACTNGVRNHSGDAPPRSPSGDS